jgi:hypothetical protein
MHRVTHPPAPQRTTSERAGHYPPLFAGLPIIVWVLCVTFIATMFVWSITKATYHSPDEDRHVGAALYWSEFHDWPGFKEMGLMFNVMRSHDLVRSKPHAAATATARPDRPSFADLTRDDSLYSHSTVNQMSQHPPLYYVILGEIHSLLPVDTAADLEVWIMRFLSILLMAPLPLLAAALARRLGASRPIVIVAASLFALVPGIASIGGAVNNDNLLNAASGWALFGVGCVLTGDLRARTAVWIGLALALALMAKAFALPIAAGVGIAYLVTIVRSGATRSGWTSLAIVIGLASLGGWWWVHNLVLYGTLQPAGHGAALPNGPLNALEAFPLYATRFVDVFFSRFWAGMDPPGYDHPAFWLSVIASILALGVLFIGLIRLRRHSAAGEMVVNCVTLLTPFVLAFVILVYSTYRITMNTGYAAGVQGRYLYCAVLGAIVVTALFVGTLLPKRVHPIAMLAIAVAGLSLMIWRVTVAVIGAWTATEPSLGSHLQALLAWSPLPYAASVTVFVLFVVAIITTTAMVAREYVGLRRSSAAIGSHAKHASRRSSVGESGEPEHDTR